MTGRSWAAAVAVAVAAGGASWAGAAMSSSSAPAARPAVRVAVSGSVVTLPDLARVGELRVGARCVPLTPRVAAGDRVTVVDASGRVVGVAPVGAGRLTGRPGSASLLARCALPFRLEVPAGAFVTFRLPGAYPVTVRRAELSRPVVLEAREP